MISQEKIDSYRKQLEAEKEKLLAQLKDTAKPVDFGQDTEDHSEEEDEAEELVTEAAIGQAFRNRISEIDSTLFKIQSGNYGRCEKCGIGISATILDKIPEAKFCEHCKK
ncbi:MAG: hypothetical protein AAB686_02725 [Patescibacteria group bacterium]